MRAAFRIAIVAEDQAFADFLRPACLRLAQDGSLRVELMLPELTRGCRGNLLVDRVRSLRPGCDLLVVGADSCAEGRGGRVVSHQRKARLMREYLDRQDDSVLAIAHPCVEGWLLADPRALRDGLSAAMGVPFVMPKEWPNPSTEREAKASLASVVSHGVSGTLARNGFEYAAEIVGRSHLIDSMNPSLQHWAQQMQRRLQELGDTSSSP